MMRAGLGLGLALWCAAGACASAGPRAGSGISAAEPSTPAEPRPPAVHALQAQAPQASPTPASVAPPALGTGELRAVREHAQRRILRPQDALVPDLPRAGTAQPSDLPGSAVALEHPAGVDALEHFYSALTRLEQPEAFDADPANDRSSRGPSYVAPKKLRIAIFGASGTAQDMWTAYVRAYLQKRFGDGGPGMVAAAPDNRWFHHNELAVTGTTGWVAANPQRKPLQDSNAYGLGLVVMRGIPTHESKKRSGPVTSTLAPAPARALDLGVTRYEIWSRAQRGGGSFSVAIDGTQRATIDTRVENAAGGSSSAAGAFYHAYETEPGAHTLTITLTGDAEVQLFGVVAETEASGVVLDNLGFVGARSAAHLQNDEALWAQQMQRRSYDLYVLAYGTNEGFHDRSEPIDAALFEREWAELLARFERAAPDASCVVMLPGLHDAVPEGALSPAPRIATIRPIMAKLALARGCALFDSAVLHGAADGMRAWVQAGLARQDHVHLTPRGHARMGMALADALMEGWDRSRAQGPALVNARP